MAGMVASNAGGDGDTLGSPATLYKIPAGSELIGMSPCPEKDAVVLSLTNLGVSVQSVGLRRTLSTLSFPKARQLTCAAIAHEGSYYACTENELIQWNDSTRDFASSVRVPLLTSKVVSPVTAMYFAAGRLWLAHKDGSWSWSATGSYQFKRVANPWQTSAKIVWSGQLQRAGQPCLVAFYVLNETYRLFFADPSADAPLFAHEDSFLSPTQRFLACTTHRNSMLLTLWSDNTMQIVYFADEVSSTSTVTSFMLRFARLDVTLPTQILSINGTHALVLSSEGPAAPATATLVDTEYGTVQGSVAVGSHASSHAAVTNGTAVLCTDSQVSTVPVSCEEISLAAAIGKMVPKASLLVEPARADNPLQSFIPFWSTEAQTKQEDWLVEQTFNEQRLSAFVEALSNPAKLPTLAAFDKAFTAYQEQLNILYSPMPQAVVNKIVARILAEPKYFALDALTALLNTELVHFPTIPTIFETLLQNKQSVACELAVAKVAEIPEAELIRCFSILLATESHARYTTDAAVERLGQSETALEMFIRACMARTWTEENLVASVATFALKDVLTVLSLVLVWFRRHCRYSREQLSTRFPHKAVPSMAQTVEWLSCMLDAHFTALILNAASHQILQVLQKELTQQTEMCERAGDLTGILEYITKRVEVHTSADAYTVETLNY